MSYKAKYKSALALLREAVDSIKQAAATLDETDSSITGLSEIRGDLESEIEDIEADADAEEEVEDDEAEEDDSVATDQE